MKNIQWIPAKTYSDAPHEYIRRQDDPSLFQSFREAIEREGVVEKFSLRGRTARYRYYYPGDGYRYWIIGIILNRCRLE